MVIVNKTLKTNLKNYIFTLSAKDRLPLLKEATQIKGSLLYNFFNQVTTGWMVPSTTKGILAELRIMELTTREQIASEATPTQTATFEVASSLSS